MALSYEGYEQVLCENGHESSVDCYESEVYALEDEYRYGRSVWRCACGALAKWWNSVDETNGAYCDDPECEKGQKRMAGFELDGTEKDCENCVNGRIDGYVELVLKTSAQTKCCPWCKHTEIVEEEIYDVPEGCIKGHFVNGK